MGFSIVQAIKNNSKNRLDITTTMKIRLTNSIKSRIDKIILNQ